jgi:DNA-binding transcriptional LysR family regulator
MSRLPDLESLHLLVTVAETGSLGAAARALGVSQPAASLRLKGLEQDLGVQLVTRSPAGSSLTALGTIVVDWAGPLVRDARDFRRRVAELTEREPVTLRVAASLTIIDHLLPDWLSALHAVAPQVSLTLDPLNSERVAEAVRAGTVDLGFVEGTSAPSGLRSRVVGDDALVVVVSPRHPLARAGGPVSAERLAGTALVLRERGSGTREVLEAALAAHGLTATSSLQIGSTTAIKAALADGERGAVLSARSVRDEIAAGTLVEIPTPDLDLRRRFRALWRSGSLPTGPALTLLSVATLPRQ